MDSSLIVTFVVLPLLAQLYVNIRLTHDISGWVPDARRRKAFFCLVWLLPVVGALYVYRRLAPQWFTRDSDSRDIQSTAAAGLMGLDSIFNPGARNIAEVQKRGEITIKAEGEMYDRELPAFIDVEATKTQTRDDTGFPLSRE